MHFTHWYGDSPSPPPRHNSCGGASLLLEPSQAGRAKLTTAGLVGEPSARQVSHVACRQGANAFEGVGLSERAEFGACDDGQAGRGGLEDVVQSRAVTASDHSDGADSVEVEQQARAVDNDHAPPVTRLGVEVQPLGGSDGPALPKAIQGREVGCRDVMRNEDETSLWMPIEGAQGLLLFRPSAARHHDL